MNVEVSDPGAPERADCGEPAYWARITRRNLLQIALGLAIVVARVVSRGTLDVQDAGLLEG